VTALAVSVNNFILFVLIRLDLYWNLMILSKGFVANVVSAVLVAVVIESDTTNYLILNNQSIFLTCCEHRKHSH
jgi:hypothetical protein